MSTQSLPATPTVEQYPATARSDVRRPIAPVPPVSRRPYFWHGTLLTVGASAWAGSMVVLGMAGPTENAPASELLLYAGTSGLFQLGLLALLRVLYRTGALGTGRVARAFLLAETVLVTLAIGSTLADGLGVSDLTQPGWALLDAFWPFSMLGMFGIAIRIAIAGRWRGASRYWPLVAESWAVVVIPTLFVLGPAVAVVVAIVHLLVGYATLGQIVARKAA